MPDVFVSHASADDDVVTRLHDTLEAATGRDLWVDHTDIRPGQDWQEAVDRALLTCPDLLLVLSRSSASSKEVTGEWRKALASGHRLLIAVIDDVPHEDIPSRLQTIQWVNLHDDWDGGVTSLVAAIHGSEVPDGGSQFSRWPLTGTIDPRLTQIPISGRDEDLARIKVLLKQGPTSILGVGGLGKSRLAAEIVMTADGIGGAVWYTASDVSYVDDVIELLRSHFDLDPTTSRRKTLAQLHTHKRLIVIDNAESVPLERREAYATLIAELYGAGALVLLTARVEWDQIVMGLTVHPSTLLFEAAEQVVRDMGQAFAVACDLSPHSAAIARAARQHPRLIEWAVRQTKKFPPEKVVRDLNALTSKRVQDALDEMILKTLRQMTEMEGPEAEAALKRLAVCRGSFTYEAAAAILDLEENEETLDTVLATLQAWQFVTLQAGAERTRYELDPLVVEVIGEYEQAHEPHFDYYDALVQHHARRQDYQGIDVESANLGVAFEWALQAGEGERAFWFASACAGFLSNRGRFAQRMDWILRVTRTLAEHPDEDLQAASQNNLGNAYRDLASLEQPEVNLRRAIVAYEAALRYSTPETVPLAYATTQNNLGNAYWDLADLEQPEVNLRRAIVAYEAALCYFTPETAPLAYAMTQNNLGLASWDLADLE